jgi:nickel-dependent lactate racemase
MHIPPLPLRPTAETTISNSVKIQIAAWGETADLELSFPDTWSVTNCRMRGHDAPALTDEEIRASLAAPHGTPRLREMAGGASQVAILFDDLIRPTPVYRVAPFVLEELHGAGIEEDQIRFVAAIGTHAPMTRAEIVKKLGSEIVERYAVYNHNIYENVVLVGETSFGTPVYINREVASCDLRVGIGGVIPYYSKHIYNGGGKIVLPGISGIETIADYHLKFQQRLAGQPPDPRITEQVPLPRLNIEETARLAALDMKVDLVQNGHREVVGLFAGDFVETHRRAAAFGKSIYTTTVAPASDIVIVNAYPMEDQPAKGLWLAVQSVKPGGDVVIISHSDNGLGHTHYLFGRFGTDFGGRGWSPGRRFQVGEAGRVIICSPYTTKSDRDNFPGATFVKSWPQARALLEQGRSTPAAVAIYPCAPIQSRD